MTTKDNEAREEIRQLRERIGSLEKALAYCFTQVDKVDVAVTALRELGR